MRSPIGARLEVTHCNIVTLAFDAIVNAANASVLGGGGVDGAIHRAAGPALLEECRKLHGCPPGGAPPTRLSIARTIRDSYRGAGMARRRTRRAANTGLLLSQFASHRALAAAAHDSLPAISCGVYGYPAEAAARIAVAETAAVLAREPNFEKIWLVCFDETVHQAYLAALREMQHEA